MDDVEYILRIILKARDEMAAVLAKARTQLRGFAKDSDTMNVAVTNLNQAMKNFDNNMDNITRKMQSWRAILKDAGDESKKTSKALDDLGKSADKTSKTTKAAAQTQEQLQKRARALRDEVRAVTKAHDDGLISTKTATAEYNKFGKELDKLVMKMTEAARKKTPAHQWADEAEEAADRLKAVNQRTVDDAKRRAAEEKKALDDITKAVDDYVKRRESAEKTVDEGAERRAKTRTDAVVEGLLKQQKEQERIAKAAADDVARIENQAAAQREAQSKRWDSLRLQARERMNQAERLGRQRARITDETDPSEIRRLVSDYNKLANSYRGGSARAREFGAEAERLRTSIRRVSGETDRSETVFAKWSKTLNRSHASAAGFDNQLRGIGILAAVASIDQLISAAIALGGELVSLAGSAVMAGGALGGILAAGAAQALPVLGLLAGAAQRVSSVLDAVTAQQQLQKVQFTDAEKGSQKAIDKATALANANDAVADANDRLAESRKNLTDVQKEGTDQLQDLILAEKQAALAAKGAALDVKSAQEALRLAVQKGASQLEIDQKRQALEEAKLGRMQAGVGARRATRDRRAAGGDVGNLDSVKAAAKQVADAEKAVTRANRALDEAADKADRAAGSTMTAAANLNFLLSQLSPAERKLYETLSRTYDTYKKVFQGTGTGGSGIYGVIIDSFTKAVDKVNDIMKMPEVVAGIQALADVIGENIGKIVDAIDPATIEQLLTIIGDAGDNLGPLVDMAIKLAKAFLDIAEFANPALQELIKYLGPIVDDFIKLTSNRKDMESFFKSGEEHLESWLDLILAVVGLFAALVGASAEDGKKSIDDLTKSVKGWTDWINDHHDQVVGFFHDARKAAYAIGGVLENLVVTLGKSFSPDRVEKFAGILNDIVIPALSDFIDWVGKLTDIVADLLDNPLLAQLAKWAIAFLLLTKLTGPIVGMFSGAAKWALRFADEIARFSKFISEIGPKLVKFTLWLGRLPGILSNLAKLMPFVFGPWGAIIAVVLVGVLLLLHHFGKLHEMWEAVKETAAKFVDDIKPAIKTLTDALDSIGLHIDSVKDVTKVLGKILKALAEYISTDFIEVIKGIGKILAGVFNIVIYAVAGAINAIHGIVDILIGLYRIIKGVFSGNPEELKKGFNQILDGFEGLVKGIIQILGGIVIGLIDVFEGLVDIFLAPFKAAWKAVKDFLGISSPSKKFTQLGRDIIEGVKDGLVGLARWLTAPWRRAWNAINDFFDGKPKRLAERIIDEFVDHMRVLWRRVRNAASFLWDKFKEAFNAARNFGTTIVNAIVEGFKGLPGALLKLVTDIGGQLLDVGKAIGNKIWDGIKSGIGKIGDLVGIGGDDKDKDQAKAPAAAQKPASTVSFDIGVGAIPFGAKDLKDAQNIYGDFWKELRRTARVSTDYIQRQFREMRIATSESSDRMYRAIRGSLRDIQNSFEARGEIIGDTWSDRWLNINKVAHDGLFYIAHETNKMLKGLSEKTINFGLTAPKKADSGKASGGFVGKPGQRGVDKGLYALGAGEAVLNWAHQRYIAPAVEAFYGHPFEATFDRVHAYHAGGPGQAGFAAGGMVQIPGQPAGETIHPSIVKDVVALAKRYRLLVTDGFALTGHAAGGEHPKGLAIDAVPGPGGSWDLVDQLAAWAEPRQNQPRSPFRWVGYNGDPNHGRGNHIHLSWMAGKTLHGVADLVTSIAKRMVTGPDGGHKRILQAAIEMARKAANKFIDTKQSYDPEGSEPGAKYPKGVLTQGQVESTVKKALDMLGITTSIGLWVKALVRQAHRESGFNPNAINNWDINAQRGDPSRGLIQTIGATFARFKFPGHNNIYNPLDNVLAAIQYIIATYGGGNSDRGAQVIWGRGGGAYAEGGSIPGPDGAPVPILAHAGEWVLNKIQQSKLANWLGTSVSSIRDAFGFSGGPTAYAGGGTVRERQLKAAGKIVSTVDKDLSDQVLQNVAQSLSDLHGLMRAVPKITKITKSVKPIIDLIELSTKEGGFLDQLRDSIERQFARAALSLRRRQFSVGRDRVVTRRQDDVQVARAALTNVRGQRDELTDERSEIQKELKVVTRRIRGARGDARRKLMADRVELTKRLDDSQERVVQNTEDIFNAQEELARAQEEAAQKRKDDFQKAVDAVKDKYTKLSTAQDLAKRVATALGNTSLTDAANDVVARNIQNNINELQGKLAAARGAGYTDIADTIQADIDELQVQIVELAQQRLRDAMDAISTAASRRGTVLDLFGRMADAMGLVGQGAQAAIPGVGGVGGLGSMSRAQVAQGRIDSAVTERAGYVGLLGQAQAAGNVGLAQELTDKINELTVVIVENTKAARDAKFAATQESFDFNTSMNDLQTQLVAATDAATGQTSSAELLRLAQEKLALYSARTLELQTQLQEAMLAGDVKATQDLQKALLENQIAVQQNTKAVNEITGAGTAPASYSSTAWQWFRTAFLTGTGGVMPQYTPPVMADVNSIGPAGTSSTTNNGATIVNNFEINEAGQPIDPTKLASTVVFAQSTAQ